MLGVPGLGQRISCRPRFTGEFHGKGIADDKVMYYFVPR